MAGIGFELKKLFVGRGAIRKLRAYAYASIVCSGTMLLAMVLLLGIEELAKLSGAAEHERETLVSMVIYAMLFSMLLTSLLQTLLSRYVADMLYREMPERVMPSLLGASLLLMVPGGLAFALLLWNAPGIPAVDRVLDGILFLELIPIWLQMAYITAAKDYRRILEVFAAGVISALALGAALIFSGLNAQTTLLIALAVGYGVMLTGFTGVLLRYFPSGFGSPFAFIEWFDHTPNLMAIGLFGMAGAFAHLILMWFSPLGESVSGPFRQAATHDAAAFFAFLVTLPANISFVVSVEVNFYQKYRQYFNAIIGGGTLSEISSARESMNTVLKQEVFKLAQVQVFFMVAYIIVMRYFLKAIGFTTDMIAMFQIMSIGYSAFAIGNSMMLLLLYFNDQFGALISTLVFFAVNTAVTAWAMNGPPLYYDIGLVAGGILMYLTALPRLFRYVKRIDYHVFCGQPVLAPKGTGKWTRAASWLDARAAGQAKNTKAGREVPS